MPSVMPMRSVGAPSKLRGGSSARALARAKAEHGREDAASGPTTLVRVPATRTVGLLSSQLRACGAGAGGSSKAPESDVERMRSKLFGNGVDLESRFGSNYVSSGSEHEINSVCLGAMVDRFMEDEADGGRSVRSRCSCKLGGSMCDCSELDDYRSSMGGELSEILQDLVASTNATERLLLAEVSKAIALAGDAVSAGGGVSSCARRQVMKHLRSGGYNAAICKSRWEHVGSFPGGEYEYMDVVFEGTTGRSERVMIDIEFRAQFEIARPSARYSAVAQALPSVFVGKAERLFEMVNIMSDAVKQSVKKSGMHLPPWRKPEYVRAKWFSSYRRTTNDTVHRTHGGDMWSDMSRMGAGDVGAATEEMEVDFLRGGERRKNAVARRPAEVAMSTKAAAVVNNVEWTPPALKPRAFQRRGQAGLASILREAGLTSSIRSLIEEHRLERKGVGVAV